MSCVWLRQTRVCQRSWPVPTTQGSSTAPVAWWRSPGQSLSSQTTLELSTWHRVTDQVGISAFPCDTLSELMTPARVAAELFVGDSSDTSFVWCLMPEGNHQTWSAVDVWVTVFTHPKNLHNVILSIVWFWTPILFICVPMHTVCSKSQ